MYREYAVMQPLQRSYGITSDRIEKLISDGALNSLYDRNKVEELENSEKKLSAKEQKTLLKYQEGKPVYEAIITALNQAISDQKWMSPATFTPVLQNALTTVNLDKKTFEKVMGGLSEMDKNAEIQKDKKGNILYDKDTKDTENVNLTEDIDTYMKREVLPYVPDAKWFFEEDLSKKKPVIKTGAEIPFTRYFYKYQKIESLDKIRENFLKLAAEGEKLTQELFGEELYE